MDIDYDNLKLITPCIEYRKSFTEAVREHKRHKVEDFNYPRIRTSKEFRLYLQNLDDFRYGRDLPSSCVPSSAFWLTDGKNYIGSADVRHYLNESLKTFGGHIGYSIRPSLWGRGLGSLQLSLVLKEAKALGITTARITCFDENIGSVRVLEKNNAVLIDKVYNNIKGKDRLTRIYEIEL